MKIRTPFEIWTDIPDEDIENRAHTEKWVRAKDVFDIVMDERYSAQEVYSALYYELSACGEEDE